MNAPAVDPKLSLALSRRTPSMPAESKDESAGQAWQREMERAQAELWLSHGAVGYTPRMTPEADASAGVQAPPEPGERKPEIAVELESRHPCDDDPDSQAQHVLIDSKSEPETTPVGHSLAAEWSPSQLSRFWESHESGDLLPSPIATREPPINRLASDSRALPALMAVNERQHVRAAELLATKPFIHPQTNAIAGLIERWSGESVLHTSSTVPGSVAFPRAENPMTVLPVGASRSPLHPESAPDAWPLSLVPSHPVPSTATATGVLHVAAAAFPLRGVEVSPDVLRSGSTARTPLVERDVDQPIRLHADWSDDGVRLWLGMRADLVVGIDSLTAQLQRWMAAQGVRVLSISCNGKQLDTGRIHPDAGEGEDRAVGVATGDVSAEIYPGLKSTSLQEFQ
jgi:hypothetical protein